MSAIDIANQRLANGEISVEEYDQIISRLSPSGSGQAPMSPDQAPAQFQQTPSFITFSKAKYEATCTYCHGNFIIEGRTLASSASIACPLCRMKISLSPKSLRNLRIRNTSLGIIRYRRFADFFSYEGRVGIGTYWFSMLIVMPFLLILMMIHPAIYSIAFVGLLHPIWIKRLHDHGMSGAWVIPSITASLLGIIVSLLMPSVVYEGQSYPFLGAIYGLSLLAAVVIGVMQAFVPGQRKVNRYGPPLSQIKVTW